MTSSKWKRLPNGLSAKMGRRRWLAVAVAVGVHPLTAPSGNCDEILAGNQVQLAGGMQFGESDDVLRLKPIDGRSERVVVTAMAADPSGKYIAVAGDDLAIRVIDAVTMQVIRTIAPTGKHHHRDTIRTLVFDGEGTRLASAGNDGRVAIYKRSLGFNASHSITGAPAIACVRFSPDGKQLAAVGFDDEVFLMGKTSGRGKLTCGCKDLRTIAYSDDGQWMAIGGRVGDVHLFSTKTMQQVADTPLHDGRIQAAVFRRGNPTLVTVGDDGHVCVCDAESNKRLHRNRVADGHLYCVVMLDSRIAAAGCSDNKIYLINTDDGKVIGELPGHTGSVNNVVTTGDWIYSGGYDATIRRWSIQRLSEAEPMIAGGKQRIADGQNRIER